MAELRVLMVCTGNVCRSPAAERLLSTWLEAAGVRVGSAGTHALVGEPMTEPMARLVDGAGGVADGFRSRQLVEELVAQADLVLAMTREHREEVVSLHPPAVRKAFTLREFVRLGRTVPPAELPGGPAAARLAALVPAVLAARTARRSTGAEDDVEDPYRLGDEAYCRSFGQILPAIHGILELAVG